MATSKYLEIPVHLLPLIEKRDLRERRGKERRQKKAGKSGVATERRSGRDSRARARRKVDR